MSVPLRRAARLLPSGRCFGGSAAAAVRTGRSQGVIGAGVIGASSVSLAHSVGVAAHPVTSSITSAILRIGHLVREMAHNASTMCDVVSIMMQRHDPPSAQRPARTPWTVRLALWGAMAGAFVLGTDPRDRVHQVVGVVAIWCSAVVARYMARTTVAAHRVSPG
jgi:hypothetical protein